MRLGNYFLAFAVVSAGAIAIGQAMHSGHSEDVEHAIHGEVTPVADPVLMEPGQGAFAALAEVVRVLEADLSTNWARVDLVGLRAHLVDMDRLMTDAEVSEDELPNGIMATATGDAETVETLRRMVPAHAAQLARDERWTVEAIDVTTGITLRLTSDDPAVVTRIRGLGFFGLMASQDHHREHHLMIARGQEAHQH